MKRQFIFGTMLSAALAVGVGAQQPTTGSGSTGSGQSGSGSSSTRSSSGAQSQSTGQTMTVTGCLQAANGSTSGSPSAGGAGSSTAGGAGSTASSGSSRSGGFILTQVSSSGSMASGSGAGS